MSFGRRVSDKKYDKLMFLRENAVVLPERVQLVWAVVCGAENWTSQLATGERLTVESSFTARLFPSVCGGVQTAVVC